MPPIAVITDTDSSLPLDLAKKYNIVQIPIIVQFGEESFRDVYDIDNAAVFSRVDREGKLPTTAAPSPGNFVEAFKSAFDSGADQILCLTISQRDERGLYGCPDRRGNVHRQNHPGGGFTHGGIWRGVDGHRSGQGHCRRRFAR